MKIEVIESPPCVPLVRVEGEIDLHTCPELRTTLQRIHDDGHDRFVLDIAAVPYVDSAALGVLVDAQRRVKEKNGEIVLVGVTPFVKRAFEITRLIRFFRLVGSVEEALIMAGSPPTIRETEPGNGV